MLIEFTIKNIVINSKVLKISLIFTRFLKRFAKCYRNPIVDINIIGKEVLLWHKLM